ncbi:uncharacterized protein LOC130692365 [Daphnia carinata]|uniref:uncharacterized protein LOC130692365 n=1 Tax=Daphnia carinata TaxID=120202 RepID=UPI00257A566C|nr:uncharacterized protein LOC130692365 [Daphnia carinata]
MPSNNFGWSLSDTVENPRRTGLANFRYKLLQYQSNVTRSDDDEDLPTKTQHRLVSDETTAYGLVNGPSDFPFSRSVKPYYGREPSVSQWSDSCFGSEYPSLTSTGSPEPEILEMNTERARPWINLSEANQSTGWMATTDDVPRTSSGPPSTTSTDVWRGSIHYAKAVMERREGEISSLFDQLHEIEDDLTSMNNQVGQVSSTLQQCSQRRRLVRAQHAASSLYQSQSVSSLHSQQNSSPFSSFTSQQQRRSNCAWSCRNLDSLTEDEMADIVHRLLTRICEFTLARQEGRKDIPLIV